jgi:hypothetical protein
MAQSAAASSPSFLLKSLALLMSGLNSRSMRSSVDKMHDRSGRYLLQNDEYEAQAEAEESKKNLGCEKD